MLAQRFNAWQESWRTVANLAREGDQSNWRVFTCESPVCDARVRPPKPQRERKRPGPVPRGKWRDPFPHLRVGVWANRHR